MDLRYITERRNRNGTRRIYWQRPGHALVRLDRKWPDIWPKIATKLNLDADLGEQAQDDTLAGVIDGYRDSDAFNGLSDSSHRVYARWLDEYRETLGRFHPQAITRRVVVDFLKTVPGAASRRQAAAVLGNVLNEAMYRGLIQHNPALRLRLRGPGRRDVAWSDDEMARFLDACRGHRHERGLRAAVALLLYTGQRPVDVCRMRRSDYDGTHIRVVQQKTGKRMRIRCHRALAPVLEANRSDKSVFLVARDNGRPLSRALLAALVREVAAKAGIVGRQARDFRQTAAIKLAELGCAIPQICAITGHSPSNVRSILEAHYLSPTTAMGDAAIERWESADPNALER